MTDTHHPKINLGLLFGGRSCEHEISVTSARSILKAIDQQKYNIHLIGIDKQGVWHLGKEIDALIEQGEVSKTLPHTVLLAGHFNGNLVPAKLSQRASNLPRLDVIFPVLHGTFGEDGCIQGVFEMANIPYVGCGVAASALAMDKALAKMVFHAAGIPQMAYVVVTSDQWVQKQKALLDKIASELGTVVFIKPANLGSSVGISKADNQVSLIQGIQHALEFDNKIIIEQAVQNAHEVECSVLGNQEVNASVVGEIIAGAEFYNYETKYINDTSETIIPAPLTSEIAAQVKALAIHAFKAIDGRGLARVDFFVKKEAGEIILNEINTLPGFTPISMYPKLWSASGLDYDRLIDRLIELAIENHQHKQKLKRAF